MCKALGWVGVGVIPLNVAPRHLPTRNVKERQQHLEQVLRHHALRVGLCVFQQIFEVLVVDRLN